VTPGHRGDGAAAAERPRQLGAAVAVGEALRAVAARLAAAGVPTPQVDAALLVRHVLGWSQTALVARGGEALGAEAAGRLEELAARRAAREPLQLILRQVGFRWLTLEVRPGVFVPRPETEVLAGEAVARLPHGGVAVEPCTGTGAVACALAQEVPGARVVATDAAPAAVALARANAARLGVRVDVRAGDLLAPVPADLRGTVDVLVCNPPYLADDELATLEPEVRDHDPLAALVSGPTGHEVTDRLLAEAPAWLKPGGWLLLETADTRARETAARARTAGYADVTVMPDLTGRDRVVAARTRGPLASPQ
jgi:release factor glutamine methyltransferase